MPDARGLLLAFDYGKKRIGVATGNGLTRTATPLTTLQAGAEPPWPAIDALIKEWRPRLIVVGQPESATDADLLHAVADFVAALKQRYGIEVQQVDESYSSVAAESALRDGRREGILARRLRREQIDQHAACLIAEQWMNQSID